MKEKHNAVSFNLISDNILGHDHRNSDDVLSDVVRGHDPLLGWEALGARSKTRSVDSGSPFVDSGTHFVVKMGIAIRKKTETNGTIYLLGQAI